MFTYEKLKQVVDLANEISNDYRNVIDYGFSNHTNNDATTSVTLHRFEVSHPNNKISDNIKITCEYIDNNNKVYTLGIKTFINPSSIDMEMNITDEILDCMYKELEYTKNKLNLLTSD